MPWFNGHLVLFLGITFKLVLKQFSVARAGLITGLPAPLGVSLAMGSFHSISNRSHLSVQKTVLLPSAAFLYLSGKLDAKTSFTIGNRDAVGLSLFAGVHPIVTLSLRKPSMWNWSLYKWVSSDSRLFSVLIPQRLRTTYLRQNITAFSLFWFLLQVANIKKETQIVWYKDEREISVDEKHDFKDGICTLLITEVGGHRQASCCLHVAILSLETRLLSDSTPKGVTAIQI